MFTSGFVQNCLGKDEELIVIDLDEKLRIVKSLDSLKKIEIRILRKSITDSITIISPVMGTSTCVFIDYKDGKKVHNYEGRITDNCSAQSKINFTGLKDEAYVLEFASCYTGIQIKVTLVTIE